MKGFKLKVDMDLVNTVLLVVILALVVYCLVKQNERFGAHEGNNSANVNADVLAVFRKYQKAAMTHGNMNSNSMNPATAAAMNPATAAAMNPVTTAANNNAV